MLTNGDGTHLVHQVSGVHSVDRAWGAFDLAETQSRKTYGPAYRAPTMSSSRACKSAEWSLRGRRDFRAARKNGRCKLMVTSRPLSLQESRRSMARPLGWSVDMHRGVVPVLSSAVCRHP